MPIPLVASNPFDTIAKPFLHSAYSYCLDLEQNETKYGWLEPQMCARLLGYMILEAPTEEGRKEIALDITRCARQGNTNTGLQALAELYAEHFLRVCESSTVMYLQAC